VHVGDADNDGIADVLVAGNGLGGPTLRWVLGDPARQFPPQAAIAAPDLTLGQRGIAAFDRNRDGFDDVAALTGGGARRGRHRPARWSRTDPPPRSPRCLRFLTAAVPCSAAAASSARGPSRSCSGGTMSAAASRCCRPAAETNVPSPVIPGLVH
jgi:hypothetical protein